MLTLHISGRPVATSPDFEHLEQLYHTHCAGNVFEPSPGWITAMSQFPPIKRHGNSKASLKAEQIAQIRKLRGSGWTYKRIAGVMRTSTSTINHVCNRTGAYH